MTNNLVNTQNFNYSVQTSSPGKGSSLPPLYGQPLMRSTLSICTQLCIVVSSQELVCVLLQRKYDQFRRYKRPFLFGNYSELASLSCKW